MTYQLLYYFHVYVSSHFLLLISDLLITDVSTSLFTFVCLGDTSSPAQLGRVLMGRPRRAPP